MCTNTKHNAILQKPKSVTAASSVSLINPGGSKSPVNVGWYWNRKVKLCSHYSSIITELYKPNYNWSILTFTNHYKIKLAVTFWLVALMFVFFSDVHVDPHQHKGKMKLGRELVEDELWRENAVKHVTTYYLCCIFGGKQRWRVIAGKCR